jgi:hypothetical protein
MFILTKTKLELYAKLAEQHSQTRVVKGASPFSSHKYNTELSDKQGLLLTL